MQGLQYMWVNSTKIDKPSDRARIRPQFFQNKNKKWKEFNRRIVCWDVSVRLTKQQRRKGKSV